MAITVNLINLLLQKEINLSMLSVKTNIRESNLSILKTNKAKLIRFSTLESICKVLDCQPGDILKYIPDKENP